MPYLKADLPPCIFRPCFAHMHADVWHPCVGAATLVGVVSPQTVQLCSSLSFLTRTGNERVSWFTFQLWHWAWYRICAVGSLAAAVLRHFGVKFQSCQLSCSTRLTVLFSGGYYLLSLKLWLSWLQRKAWKHGIWQYFEVWLMTFYYEGYMLLPPFNFPLPLCMQPCTCRWSGRSACTHAP